MEFLENKTLSVALGPQGIDDIDLHATREHTREFKSDHKRFVENIVSPRDSVQLALPMFSHPPPWFAVNCIRTAAVSPRFQTVPVGRGLSTTAP